MVPSTILPDTDGSTPASSLRLFLALPFIVGTLWAFLLPTSSILTGDFAKPRGWYVDENSLETSNIRVGYKYQALQRTGKDASDSYFLLLCDVLGKDMLEKNNVECTRHGEIIDGTAVFDLVKILPTGNALDPSDEAIALVAPYPPNRDWTSSQLHFSLMQLMRRLASADTSPWLAKTIFLVSPTTKERSLNQVVDAFLESYSGSFSHDGPPGIIEPLPPRTANALIRNILVLDTSPSHDPIQPQHEVRILSQGNLGVLPNMDLVFVAMAVFSRTLTTGGTRRAHTHNTPAILYHPYSREARQWQKIVEEAIEKYCMPKEVEKWATNLCNLVLFCRYLVEGPSAPHALALDRGIDAISIEGRYSTSNEKKTTTFVLDFVHKVEIILRGLSNLHERLHHSTTLYLLPSPTAFVKHEEYLVPNLLLLIPVVLRASFLGLADIRHFDLQVIGWILLLSIGATLGVDTYVAHKEQLQRNAWFCLIYVTCFGVFYDKVIKFPRDYQSALKSAQFIICLMTIYNHIPICFGNVAIAMPSAFLRVPFVSIPTFASLYEGKVGTVSMLTWIVLTGTLLLERISIAAHARFLYFPMHLAICLSCQFGILQHPKRDRRKRHE